MRILFVNPGLALGGAEQSLLLLLQGLRARGVETLVALFGDGPFRDCLSSLGFPCVCVAPPRRVRRATRYQVPAAPLKTTALAAASAPTVLRLAALARHVRADVIHTNGLKAHLLAGVAGRLIGTPVVWHLRDFPPSGFASRVILIASRWLPALVLANSDAVAASLRSPDSAISRVSRLYNPVDLCRFHPDLPKERIRRELGLNTDVPLVGLIAHLTPWKGHETFLTIARAVTDAVPKARFVVAGGLIYETDGHAGYAETLRQRVLTLGLAGRVIFLGPRNDIPEVLAALDVLVHCPTAPEPFGRVVAEAMAVGCPVVAANSGGIPEIVDNGVTGFLAPPGDTQGFTSAVVQLLKEPALRERFGRAGRQQAEALFSVEAHTAGVLEAYRTLERSNVQTF